MATRASEELGIFGAVNLYVQIAAPRLIQGLKRFDFDPSTDDGIVSILRLASGFDNAIAGISKDPNLSATGVGSARRKIARDTATAIRAWEEKHADGLTNRIDITMAAMRRKTEGPAPSDAERLRRELRHQAILRQLEGVDVPLLTMVFNAGNAEVRQALREAPPRIIVNRERGVVVEPLIPQGLLEGHELAAAEIEAPEDAGLIRDLGILREFRFTLATAFRSELKKIAGGDLEQPLPVPLPVEA